MRNVIRIFLLFLAFPCLVQAQENRSSTSQNPGAGLSTTASDEMAALEHFLHMSDDQLAAMASAIERVRNLSPEERRQLEKQIAAYRKLPASQREQIRSGWASEEDWDDWREMIQSVSEEERSRIQNSLQALPFEERAAHKHSLLESWRADQEKSK